MAKETRYDCLTEKDTQKLGYILGQQAFSGAIFLCSGDLGAGKTCLTKGIALGLKIKDEITSPTFILIKEYADGRLPLFHMDLYRLDEQASILDLGIDDYLYGNGLCVIEWAEKTPSTLFPKQYLHIEITFNKDCRQVKITAHGALYEKYLEEIMRCI